MVQPLQTGQKFLVPLSSGEFAPGYVVHQGNLFTLVNIYSNVQDSRSEPTDFPSGSLLLRDWLIGDHVFSRSKKVIDLPWVLFRTKLVEKPDHPQIEGVVFGEHGRECVKDVMTGKVIRDPATPSDIRDLPRHGIKVAHYYSLFVEAKLLGKEVVLETEPRRYVIR